MVLQRGKLYRDRVHLDIELDPLARAIIDTPEFQRLNAIKQLGFAYLVYRNANSTRFEHLVGTYHLSREIVLALPRNHRRLGVPFPTTHKLGGKTLGKGNNLITSLARIVSYAALLHDVTHIPFGHTLEDEVLGIYQPKHDSLESPRLWYLLFDSKSSLAGIFDRREPWLPDADLSNHDLRWLITLILLYGDRIADPTAEYQETFDDLCVKALETHKIAHRNCEPCQTARYLSDLLTHYHDFRQKGLFHPFMHDVVSNTICADNLDYLRRDAAGTGLEMTYDRRLIQYFVIAPQDSAKGEFLRIALCIRPAGRILDRLDIVAEILKILELRYDAAERIYYHKTKVAASAMLFKALSLIGTKPPEPKFSGEDAASEENLMSPSMGDERFLQWVTSKARSLESTTIDEIQQVKGDPKGKVAGASLFAKPAQLPLEVLPNGAGLPVDQETTESPFMAAADLIEMIQTRKLYKPSAILTGGNVGRSLVSVLTSKYRTRALCFEEERALENELGFPTGSIIIYCPPDKPQKKLVRTLIFRSEPSASAVPSVLPLYHSPEFATECEAMTQKYQRLWKMYLLLRGDQFSDPTKRQRLVEAFHHRNAFKSVGPEEIAALPWMDSKQMALYYNCCEEIKQSDSVALHHEMIDAVQNAYIWRELLHIWPDSHGLSSTEEIKRVNISLYLVDYLVTNDDDPGTAASWSWKDLVQLNGFLPGIKNAEDVIQKTYQRLGLRDGNLKEGRNTSADLRRAFNDVFRAVYQYNNLQGGNV